MGMGCVDFYFFPVEMQFMGHKDIGKGADFDFGWAGNEVIRRQIEAAMRSSPVVDT